MKSVKETDLKRYVDEEEHLYNVMKGAQKEGIEKGVNKGIKKGIKIGKNKGVKEGKNILKVEYVLNCLKEGNMEVKEIGNTFKY